MSTAEPTPATLRLDDGITLAVRHWSVAEGTGRGTVVLVHGLGEHAARYEHVAAFLTARGWNVVGYDHRGHGRSEGKRGVVAREGMLPDDLAQLVDRVARPRTAAGRPLILLGHSLGGLIAAQFVARAVRPVEGLILSSPALAAHLTLGQRLQLAVGMLLAPDLAVSNQLEVDRLSHDAGVVRAYREDPLVHDRITPRLAGATLRGGEEVRAAAARWTVPTLILWAGEDHLVAPSGSDAFAATAPARVVRARRFDGFYHEILNEPGAAEVFAEIGTWLDERGAA